jgi:hypothetical protein
MWTALLLAQAHVAGRHADVFGEEEAARKAAGEAGAAGDRFRELLEVAPVRGAIVLTKDGKPAKDRQADVAYTRNGARWIWRWEPRRGAEPDETMTHELGHLWLTFWADGLEPPKVKRYGSSLPDWFDEGFASLLEGPKAHAAYAAAMKKRLVAGTAMPLGDLLECLHPDSREKSERKKATDRWLFYAQSYSVVAFIAEHLGAVAFRSVATKLKAGRELAAALGSDGLPGTLAEFESAWIDWAKSRE